MRGALNSQKPLRPSFQIKLNGEPVAIATVGQADRFITSSRHIAAPKNLGR